MHTYISKHTSISSHHTVTFQFHKGSKYWTPLSLFSPPVPPASVSTGRQSWRRSRGTTPSWRQLCSSPRQTSSSGNNSLQPIRRKPSGYTNGYRRTDESVAASPCQQEIPVYSVVCVFQVTELECVSGQTTAVRSQKTELNRTIEELELDLKAKEEVWRLRYIY